MRRRWTEDEARQPLDLRLALPAIAVWAGCLVAFWAPGAVWWVLATAALGLAGCALAVARGRRSVSAVAVALLCCGLALVVATLRIDAAADDPLARAAASSDWVEAELTIRGDPVPQPGRWDAAPRTGAANSDDSGATAGAPAGAVDLGGTAATAASAAASRWRITARGTSVTWRGERWPTRSSVVIFADGPAWGSVVDGATVLVRGTVGVDGFSAMSGVVIRVRGEPQVLAGPPWWTAWAARARDRLARSAEVLDADRGGLLRGLVVGDTRGIGQALSDDAKVSGLTHLVAVSGSHMAIIAGAVLLFLRRFGPRVSAIGVAAAFVALVIVVGPAPSVLRAVVMGLIAILAAVLGRARSALPALAASVFGLLLVDPSLAVAVGFVLSVQATAALILLAPTLTAALERRRVPRGWAMVLAVPIAAHLATMPVIASISGGVSLVAIPANIAVGAVVAPALLVGLACLIVGPLWPGGAEAIARVDGPLLGWISGCAHRFAHWPSAVLPWSPGVWGVLGLGALIVLGLVVFRFRKARVLVLVVATVAATVFIAAHLWHVGWPGNGWLITACDVGQGDAIVLATDQPGRAVVVDTGPDPAAMDDCLDRLGVRTIALLVVTHLHADHTGGVTGAMDGRAVAAIGLGPDRTAPDVLAELAGLARRGDIPVVPLSAGVSLTVAGLYLDVLGPARTFHGTESDANNNSVVIRASRDGVTMLLTGDIERPAQQALLDSGADLTADILKQPHHGSSKLLAPFVTAVGARVAIVGVGVGNDYGHPAAAALAMDRAAGIESILRTDRDGDVQVLRSPSGLAVMSRGVSSQAGTARP